MVLKVNPRQTPTQRWTIIQIGNIVIIKITECLHLTPVSSLKVIFCFLRKKDNHEQLTQICWKIDRKFKIYSIIVLSTQKPRKNFKRVGYFFTSSWTSSLFIIPLRPVDCDVTHSQPSPMSLCTTNISPGTKLQTTETWT